MTDADLCKALLGWEYRIGIGWSDQNGLWQCDDHHVPDFAHNIEWAMKLARAACEKWDLCYWVGRLAMGTKGTRASFSGAAGAWTADAGMDEEEAAIRAAVVEVCEAHAAKENKS